MLNNKQIQDFISEDSLAFFETSHISVDFLQTDPEKWHTNKSFNEAKNKVQQLHVVNDVAELGVALANTYVNKTTSETDFQNLLQVIKLHRKSDINN